MDNDKQFFLTPFDQNTIGNSTQMIKSLIPYLDPGSQRLLAILVRIRELLLTLRYFSRMRMPKPAVHSNDEMLCQIRQFCSPETAAQIDMMLKMFSISDMMNVLSGIEGVSPNGAGLSDMMNLFQMMQDTANQPAANDAPFSDFPMMGEHQKELFDHYMEELDNIFKGENDHEH